MSEFTQTHIDQLYENYPAELVEQIDDESNVRYAPVSGMPEEFVPYSDIRPIPGTENGNTIGYIPGFVEGRVNKASFALELASRGHRVILPGQNRVAVAKNIRGERTMTELQADNYNSVLEHAGVINDSPDIAAHSYGGLIFDAMSRRMRERGENPYKESNVFMLASAGLIEGESRSRLFKDWIRMMGSEMTKKGLQIPDLDGSTGQASFKTMLANIPRTLGEAGHLVRDKVDPELPKHVGNLVIVDYADDMLFPAERTAAHVGELVTRGAIWLTPYSAIELDASDGTKVRGVKGATHDDEQRNPTRVVNAMEAFYDYVENAPNAVR